MQLTGDRFTSETAMLGNDLATFPDFPAEIRAPAGSLPGRVRLPGPLRRPRHPHRGRPAGCARRHEPRRAEGEPAGRAEGRDDHRRHRLLQRPHPAEGGIRREPAGRRLARRLPPPRGGADVDDGRRPEGDRGRHAARGGAVEELLRPRADVVALPPADRRDDRLHLTEVRQAARDRRGQHARLPCRLELRRDVGGLRGLLRGRPCPARPRDVPSDHGEHGALLRPDRRREARRAAAVPRRLPDHARPRRSSRSSRAGRSSASSRSRQRTRSQRSALRSERRSAARSGSPPRPAPASS